MRRAERRQARPGLLAKVVACLALGSATAVAVLPAEVAGAATQTVTNCNDSGSGSLRQAIADASSGDTVSFAMTPACSTITLTTGAITASKNLTISGPGASNLAVSGGGSSAILEISAATVVSVTGITLEDGSSTTSGGGIVNDGMLTLSAVTVVNSSAPQGGGVYSDGTLTVTGSTISDDSATDGTGGGVANAGTLNVSSSTFSGDAGSQGGGAVSNLNAASTTISDSTLSANSSNYQGGAIVNSGDGNSEPLGSLTVTDSAITGNTASVYGGGISSLGPMTLTASTVADNSTSGRGGGIEVAIATETVADSTIADNSASYGGGLFNDGGATTTLSNSTVSGNSATTGGDLSSNSGTLTVSATIVANSLQGSDCAATITDGGYNLDDDGTCGFSALTDHSDVASGLDPFGLQSNGGSTQTIALDPGSAALGAVTDQALCSPPDQRGISRPSPCDIGAFETGIDTVTNCNDSGPGSLPQAVSSAVAGATIAFALSPSCSLIDLASTVSIATTLRVVGPGLGSLAVNGNSSVRDLSVSSGATVVISGLTVEGGVASSGGGGVSNSGALTLVQDQVSGDTGTGSGVGGIYNAPSSTLSVDQSTVSSNSGPNVGGVFNDSGGTLSVVASTISTNTSSGGGGGILNRGVLSVVNSTLSGNQASFGGGLYNGGVASIVSSTLSANTATGGASGQKSGGDVYNDASASALTLKASILAKAPEGKACGGNLGAPAIDTDLGYNIDDDGSCGLSAPSISNSSTLDATMGSLASNGGPTQTIALTSGPATDVVPSPDCPATDQRGVVRIPPCDMGAYDTDSDLLSQTISFASTPPSDATVGGPTYTVTATGGGSGNPVILTVDQPSDSVCAMTGDVVSFSGVGSCIINANQAGNSSYLAAAQVQQSFAVGPGAQAITFTSTPPAHALTDGAPYLVTATGGASGNSVIFTIDPSAASVCAVDGPDSVNFSGAGTCVIDANQAGNGILNAAPQVQQSFTVYAPVPTISAFTPAKSKPGKKVTISGTYLAGATNVTFNGVVARVVSDDQTTVVVVVPKKATTGKITVTTAGGTATSAKRFRVT